MLGHTYRAIRLAQEKAVFEKEKAKVVEVSVVYNNEGMSVRFEKNVFFELMNSWDIWKRLANEWQEWKDLFKEDRKALRPDMPRVAYLVDDGLGFKGDCPVHRYVHVQQFPRGKEPMKCSAAVKWMEERNATPRR